MDSHAKEIENNEVTSLTEFSQNSRILTDNENKLIELLVAGASQELASKILGIVPSRISEMANDPVISTIVTEQKFSQVVQAAERDNAYDRVEDKLLERLEKTAPLLMKPMEIAKVLSVVNAAKRRSRDQVTSPQSTTGAVLVNIVLPQQTAQRFTTTANNQVIAVGEHTMITSSANQALGMLNKRKELESVNDSQLSITAQGL